MAVIIPSTPSWTLAQGASHTFASLLGLPDDWRVWLRLPFPDYADRPDFLLLTSDHRVALLSGTDLHADDLAAFDQLSLIMSQPSPRIERFNAAIRQLTTYRPVLEGSFHILRFLICTALKPNQISADRFQRLAPGLVAMSRDVAPQAIPILMQGVPPLSLAQIAALRAQFSPETVVPPNFSARQGSNGSATTSVQTSSRLLLDFDQEAWLKRELLVPPEAHEAGDAPTTLITGVAGCGKSLVLLFRAILEAKLAPGQPILFLTHNEALAVDLSNRARLLATVHRAPRIIVQTFYKWCATWAKSVWADAVAYGAQEAALRAALGPLDHDQIRFFRDEFGWMQDNPITTEAEYLGIERRGRTFPLRRDQRPEVFARFTSYRNHLQQRGQTDWAGLALRIHDAVATNTLTPPVYQRVFLDEAQFFARTWLSVVRAAIAPQTGKIFIAADPTQGFLQRRQSWSEFGFAIRGRATRLRRAYRSTRAILLFARDFYASRGAPPDAELNLPEQAELDAAPPGQWPTTLREASQQDEAGLLVQTLRSQSPETLGQVLVLHASGSRVKGLISLLAFQLPGLPVVHAKTATGSNQLRVCSVEGATGLEAPFVFILGLRELFEAEHNPLLSTENRRQLVEEHSKLAYMAFTRAGARLFLLWSGPTAPPFPPAPS